MFCIECGTKLEANQKFCKNCGSPINITEERNEPLTTSNQKKESNAAKKNSGKKNDRLYALGFWFVNWLLITSKGGVFYSIGFTTPTFLILLASTGIPNKPTRRIVMFLLSAIFFIMTILKLQEVSY